MVLILPLAASAFVSTLFALASARPQSRAIATNSLLNVAYYGQGPNQPLLGTFCTDDTLDIIPIGFVNGLPSNNGGWPAMNFGNACGGDEYFYDGTTQTASFTNCKNLVSQIPLCQNAGKKISISIGGALAEVELESQEDAVAFANQLWDIFGPYDPSYTGPRPFGSSAVDGFDFDLESGSGSYWVDVANTLRGKFPNGGYYLSAAPQCLTSDIMTPMIQGAYFDYVWVQYFNTPQCSARNFFDEDENRSGIGFDTWAAVLQKSANPNVPLFIGLPGSSAAVPTYPDNALSVAETTELIDTFACFGTSVNPRFGGIMLWDATYALNNNDYAASIRLALNSPPCNSQSNPTTTTTTITSTTTSIVTTTSTTLIASSFGTPVGSSTTPTTIAPSSSSTVSSSTTLVSSSTTPVTSRTTPVTSSTTPMSSSSTPVGSSTTLVASSVSPTTRIVTTPSSSIASLSVPVAGTPSPIIPYAETSASTSTIPSSSSEGPSNWGSDNWGPDNWGPDNWGPDNWDSNNWADWSNGPPQSVGTSQPIDASHSETSPPSWADWSTSGES